MLFLFLGMLFGCILFFVLVINEFNYFNSISLLLNRFYDNTTYIIYVLKVRILQMLFFIIISYLLSSSIITKIYCGFIGLIYGFIYGYLFMQYGLKGMLMILLIFFPHIILYLLCIKNYDVWIEKYIFHNSGTYYGNVTLKKYIMLFIILIFYVLGIIWEIKFQKFFLMFLPIYSIK